MELLFSYGTLQKEKTQLDLFGHRLSGTKDILEGYRVETIEIKDEKFLSKGEDKFQRTLIATHNHTDTIEGTVLELTPEELLQADTYEPDNYQRINIMLRSGRKVWIYVAV